jgi:hypothetical protein
VPRHCAGRAHMSVPTAVLPRFLLHLLHPVAAHWALLSPSPACHPLAPASPAPRRPPLSRNSTAARARRPGATAGRSALPTAVQAPLPPSPAPCDAKPTPLLFPSLPHTPKCLQKPPTTDLASLPLCFSSSSAPHAAASQLLTEPVRAVLRSPHRLTTGSLSHCRRQFPASSMSQSSVRRGS